MYLSVFSIIFIILLVGKIYIYFKKYLWKCKHKHLLSVGFFHPYCNAGGGGERVLWNAVGALQKLNSNIECIVYSGDNVPAESILKNVKTRFNIKLQKPIKIIYLRSRFVVEAKNYPFCTLLMQNIGSIILGLEALLKHIPDVYIDTMGYAWTLPLFKFIGSSRVCAYVHFPTISTDMLQIVKSRQVGVNNTEFISKSTFFSNLKLFYYKIFAYFYGLAGRRAEVIMVNSSWTNRHIIQLWGKPERTFTIYPPCDTSQFSRISLEKQNNMRILSIAQFRPEKNHKLQIESFHTFINQLENKDMFPILVLVGSCRHEEDFQRMEELKSFCATLNLTEKVEFKLNLSFEEVIEEMEKASVAIHTMKDEHFGIGIVECMSAGLIMIAHESGGPLMDIVVDYNGQQTGFLANDVHTFANTMAQISKMKNTDLYKIRENARKSVERFSVSNFENTFISAIKAIEYFT